MPIDGLSYENEIRARGLIPAGVDEAGRGPLAGPVVAAAVVLPEHFSLAGIDDSKKLSPARREEIFENLSQNGAQYAVGIADAREIDQTDILRATIKAMERAVKNLRAPADFLFIDGSKETTLPLKQTAIIGGDGKCMSIAAASIVAKVTRDKIMERLHQKYPLYNFLKHKGYPTAEHRKLVKKYGTCPEHRKSFKLTA